MLPSARLLSLAVLLVAGCDGQAPEPPAPDPCPFPVSGFAEPALLFNPGKGDTLRVGERFFLSSSLSISAPENPPLVVDDAFRLVWTPSAGGPDQVLYEWPGAPIGPTTRFILEVLTTLRLPEGSPTAAELAADGTFAFEVVLEVESAACGGLDRISLVTRNEVVVLD